MISECRLDTSKQNSTVENWSSETMATVYYKASPYKISVHGPIMRYVIGESNDKIIHDKVSS